MARVEPRLNLVIITVVGIGLGVLWNVFASAVSRGPAAAAAAETTATEQPVADDDTFTTRVLPFIEKFCLDCHSSSDAMADIALDGHQTPQAVLKHRTVWERVNRMIDADAMPPTDHAPRPDDAERRAILEWLQAKLNDVDCSLLVAPVWPTMRRLNRAEYNNTIRDLVGIDLRPADDFPWDPVGYGFDNVGDVLSLSPMLMEKYLDAAERVATTAIISRDMRGSQPARHRREGDQLGQEGAVSTGEHGFYVMYSAGQVFADFDFPATGDYVLRAEAAAEQAGPELARMEFQIDGRGVADFKVRGHRQPETYEIQLRIEGGTHRFAAAFANDYYRPDAEDPRQRDRNLGVAALEIEGPTNPEPPAYPDSHRQIIFTRPGPDKSLFEAAREVMTRFASRAYRRPLSGEEAQRLTELVETVVHERNVSFEAGIQVAVQAVLVSPHFLFHVESERAADDPDSPPRLDDYELVSRLSYFLWSSMPDKELFRLAKRGRLTGTAHADLQSFEEERNRVLEEQVRRMLADDKADALVANFAGQWLNLRLLDEAQPDPQRFDSFKEELRDCMRRETELLFETIMREDRSVLELLDADFTFLNQRLAQHYGRDDVTGDDFVKVSLAGTTRRGVLTHASILTLTSNPTRTSPVKRGKWILENILGDPPPPPPPNVPSLEEAAKQSPDLTLREQLALHRQQPGCAGCHQTMDPLGLGLENFDPVGRWRNQDGHHQIDASGELPSGESFRGPLELIQILARRREKFVRTLTEKMLIYALGRGLRPEDQCAVADITDKLRIEGYRFSVLMMEIVKSDAFLQRR